MDLLDLQLSEMALEELCESMPLPDGDPFRLRPSGLRNPSGGRPSMASVFASLPAAIELRDRLLSTGHDELCRLPIGSIDGRLALVFALHEGHARVGTEPRTWLVFAERAREHFEKWASNREPRDGESSATAAVPDGDLRAHIHLLLGQGHGWTANLEAAGQHLIAAYRSLREASQVDLLAAWIELEEALRRALLGSYREARVLAARASATFRSWHLAEEAARGRALHGVLESGLGSEELSAEHPCQGSGKRGAASRSSTTSRGGC